MESKKEKLSLRKFQISKISNLKKVIGGNISNNPTNRTNETIKDN